MRGPTGMQKFFNAYADYELGIVKEVQDVVHKLDMTDGMEFISRVGDPTFIFVVFFPIIYGMNWRSGLRYLGAAIICEWLNQILKWVFHGDRPYWYIMEHPQMTPDGEPLTLKQTFMTCETGPGMPSGHVMAMVVSGTILVDTLTTQFYNKHLKEWPFTKDVCIAMAWVSFIGVLFYLGMSRVYHLNHFPHQVVGGWVFGLLVIYLIYYKSSWVHCQDKFVTASWGFLLPLIAVTIYRTLEYYEQSPEFSIIKANKYCQVTDWIHINTTPFFGMVRYSGAALGLCLCMSFHLFPRKSIKSPLEQFFRAWFGVWMNAGLFWLHFHISTDYMPYYYLKQYFIHTAMIVVPGAMIPPMARMLVVVFWEDNPHSH